VKQWLQIHTTSLLSPLPAPSFHSANPLNVFVLPVLLALFNALPWQRWPKQNIPNRTKSRDKRGAWKAHNQL